MVTFAQAQERAEEWVNGEVPAYQHREVRVREFELGFVVWAEDREGGARSDGGQQRLVIARDSGEATLWPGLPVGEVIRRYEEEYGAQAAATAAPEPPRRIDLNQTSFLLTPPEWLQDAADKIGIPDNRPSSSPASAAGTASAPPAAVPVDAVPPASAAPMASAHQASAHQASGPVDAAPADAPPADAVPAPGAASRDDWSLPGAGASTG
ncbi:SUKH-4 family immunity protein, partial [Streptomyces sp. NPDC055078]